MKLSLAPLASPAPRDQWVVSAWAVSSDGEQRQPMILHQGPRRELACQRYFEALLASDSFLLKNALELLCERQADEGKALGEQPFGWLLGWPRDFFEQGSRTELRDPKLVYFDERGEQFVATAELSEDERRLRQAVGERPLVWLRGEEGPLESLKTSVELLFEASLASKGDRAEPSRL